MQVTEMEVFGRPFYQSGDVALLLSSLGVNTAVMIVVVGLVYFRQTRDQDHTFMMTTLNLVVFLVAFSMNSVQVGVGFGFGLFALFGIVRYRTESVPVREMSFLFAAIALGLTNAVGASVLSWVEVLIANATVTVALAVLSSLFWRHRRFERSVVYDQVQNLQAGQRTVLLDDLRMRTGLEAVDIEVVSVNLVNDSAVLRVTCNVTGSTVDLRSDPMAPEARTRTSSSVVAGHE